MTKRFYFRNTDLATGLHAVTRQKELNLDVQSGGGTALVSAGVVELTFQHLFVFTSASGEPNSADWPAASTPDPWTLSMDISAAGANMQYGIGISGTAPGHVAVVLSDLSSHREASGGWVSPNNFTGTGIKVGSNQSFNPGAGAASDRLEILISGVNNNSMMSSETVTLDVDSADSWFQGPWTVAPPADSAYHTRRPRTVLQAVTRSHSY